MPPKQRLSLLEKQQQLLEEKGFSKASKPPTVSATATAVLVGATQSDGAVNGKQRQASKGSAADIASERQRWGSSGAVSSSSTVAPSERTIATQLSFSERQELLLVKQGRGNATSFSRVAVPMVEMEGGDEGDAVSVASRASKAPSIHPSLAGSIAVSMACSEATIGAGDDTGYWDFQHRACEKKDLQHTCRECRMPFTKIGEPITERRGARISTRYHAACFSGFADPRSQCRSSHHEGHLSGTQLGAAPSNKCGSKMRTSCHFEGSNSRVSASLGSMGGKLGAAMGMGHNSFGSKSSKNQGTPMAEIQRAPGGFTAEELAAFNAQQEKLPSGTTRLSLASIDEVEPVGSEAGPSAQSPALALLYTPK